MLVLDESRARVAGDPVHEEGGAEAPEQRRRRHQRRAEEARRRETERERHRGAQRGAARDAEHVRLRQGVLEQRLERRAHQREPAPGERGQGHAGEPHVDEDDAIEALGIGERARHRDRLRAEEDRQGRRRQETRRGGEDEAGAAGPWSQAASPGLEIRLGGRPVGRSGCARRPGSLRW